MDRMQSRLYQYVNDPTKNQLDKEVIEQFIKSNNEVARRELNFSEITNEAEENLYHVAVRQRDIGAIKVLNKLIPEDDRQQLLSMQRDVTAFRRFCATLAGQSAKCLTPVHLAAMKWREKNGNDAVFNALLNGLHGPLATVEALNARDEKFRTVLGLVADSKIRQQKKDDMIERISGKVSESRKEIQGLEKKVEMMEKGGHFDQKIKALEKDNSKLTQTNKKLRYELDTMTNENSKLKVDMLTLKQENKEIRGQLKGADDERSDIKRLLEHERQNRVEMDKKHAQQQLNMEQRLRLLECNLTLTRQGSVRSITSFDSAISDSTITGEEQVNEVYPIQPLSGDKPGRLTTNIPTQASEL